MTDALTRAALLSQGNSDPPKIKNLGFKDLTERLLQQILKVLTVSSSTGSKAPYSPMGCTAFLLLHGSLLFAVLQPVGEQGDDVVCSEQVLPAARKLHRLQCQGSSSPSHAHGGQ